MRCFDLPRVRDRITERAIEPIVYLAALAPRSVLECDTQIEYYCTEQTARQWTPKIGRCELVVVTEVVLLLDARIPNDAGEGWSRQGSTAPWGSVWLQFSSLNSSKVVEQYRCAFCQRETDIAHCHTESNQVHQAYGSTIPGRRRR